MKVRRTINVKNIEKYEVGDIIEFELDGSKVEAIAVKEQENNMLFCFVDCLKEEHDMNDKCITEGGFEASNLSKYLNEELYDLFPKEIKANMVKFSNNLFIRIPTERELFGKSSYGNEPETIEQWKPMKRRRNRIAGFGKDERSTWYWLASVASSTAFCVCSSYGIAYYVNASNTRGVRPVFMLKNR